MSKYVAIFHANMNYAFLIPESYERVIRSSYEVIIDGFDKYPDAKYVFEASGYTIEQMAKITPDVLAKLKAAIARGQCEFMGAPYSHPIMANIPEEDGYWSCEFAQRIYEKYLGQRIESFWNPECTWMQYVPNAFARAGVKYLTLDFESYMTCSDKDYSWTERNRAKEMLWGGHLPWYNLDPNCKFLHRPFKNIVPGLDGFCRSDRLIGKYLSYFRGNTTVEEYVDNVKKWSGNGKGATIIIADDAEYCGTTGYYFIKYKGDYSQTFLTDPDAPAKLDKLIPAVMKIGKLVTFKEACTEIEPVEEPFFVEDRFAWHRTYADAWANTPEAREWEPILQSMRKEYKEKYQPIVEAEENKEKFKEIVSRFWFHMTNSANSDGRWPPPPQATCEFNRDWCLNEIEETKKVLVELAKVTKGYTLPEPKEPVLPGQRDWRYGFHFTDKDPEDIKNLNNYELQHGIYYAHKMVDSDNAEKVEHGKKILKEIFDELDKRGQVGIRPGCITGQKEHGTK
ncbi:MAG: hypothetical protein HOO88_02510 [Kiritimatiellaceae bacterium]|nr:hypothetical protein [Kiritimatiellaceae bacterium]